MGLPEANGQSNGCPRAVYARDKALKRPVFANGCLRQRHGVANTQLNNGAADGVILRAAHRVFELERDCLIAHGETIVTTLAPATLPAMIPAALWS